MTDGGPGPAPGHMADHWQFTYETAVRALTRQEQRYLGIQQRAGTVVAVSALAASFLGSQAIDNDKFNLLEIISLAMFVVTICLCLWVIAPKLGFSRHRRRHLGPKSAPDAEIRGWLWDLTPSGVFDRISEQPNFALSEWHRVLSQALGEAFDKNEERVRRRGLALNIAIITLGAEITAWIIEAL